jgi:hypothetical protein
MSRKDKRTYIDSTFEDLKDMVEVYINSKLEIYEPVPYSMCHSGFKISADGNIQYNREVNLLVIPERILFGPQHKYLGDQELSIDSNIYIPAIEGLVAFRDEKHRSGFTPYQHTLLLTNDGFRIKSNLAQ